MTETGKHAHSQKAMQLVPRAKGRDRTTRFKSFQGFQNENSLI